MTMHSVEKIPIFYTIFFRQGCFEVLRCAIKCDSKMASQLTWWWFIEDVYSVDVYICWVGEVVVIVLLFEGKMVFGLGRTWSGCRGLICSNGFAPARTAAASNSLIAGCVSSAVWRSQMYWMTFWMTSSFDNLRFFGMKGTRSLSLLMYIWISAFSPSRWRETRPLAMDGTEAPVEHTAVIAFIFFCWILNGFTCTPLNEEVNPA